MTAQIVQFPAQPRGAAWMQEGRRVLLECGATPACAKYVTEALQIVLDKLPAPLALQCCKPADHAQFDALTAWVDQAHDVFLLSHVLLLIEHYRATHE